MAGGITPLWEWSRKNIHIKNALVKEAIAEFLATLILCMFAVAAVTSAYLQPGDSMQPAWGGVIGLMMAILICGGISGPHVNPAVTFGLAIAGDVSWYKFPVYVLAQTLGGYVGAGIAAANYAYVASANGKSFTEYYPAGIFSHITTTTPVANGILDQIIGTAMLLITVLAVIDKRNMQVPKALFGFFFALTVAAIIFCFGYNSGSPINPARDLGPRLMAWTIGYGASEVFTPGDKQWWTVGFFGPFIGAAVGSILYIFLIGAHLEDTEEEKQQRREQERPTTHFQPQPQPMYESRPTNSVAAPQQQQNSRAYNRQAHSPNFNYDLNGNNVPPSPYGDSQYNVRGGVNGKSYA